MKPSVDKKIKIFLFIPSLTAGGAERVMLFVAKNLNKEKFDVKLIIIGFKKDTVYNTKGVDLIYLNKSKVSSALFKILKLFLQHRPDIVFGSLTHVNYNIALVSYLFPKTICIARETFVLSVGKQFNNWDQKAFHKINAFVSNIAHKRIDYFICQSEDMKNDMNRIEKYESRKIVTINNPVSEDIVTKDSIPPNNTIHFITVGRLVKQKGHERIIKALSSLKIPYSYTIIGDGKEKNNIFSYAKEKNVYDKIIYIPKTHKVYQFLENSHFYLQGSYLEGFPNALIESLAIGTPALVYEAPGGMNEIIIQGKNGFMAKSDADFIEKMSYLINNQNSFQPKQVANHVRTKFAAHNIIDKYESLFNHATR